MTPVIPYSISNVSLIPGTAFTARRNYSARLGLSRKTVINAPSSQSFLLSRSASFRLLSPFGRGCSLPNQSRIHLLRATETEVVVEESESPVSDEVSGEVQSNDSSAQSKRTRPVRKSDLPPVSNEELVVGASFTGKVRSIQPFGAFVDFGAFTDGLVHVSQLSDSFVKEVGSVVSVGQEVKVRLIEANMESGRISLSMRENDDGGKERGGPGRKNTSKPGQRKGDPKKASKFVKGQDLEGTVKNMNKAGSFIALPEGEEGFLPMSEEIDDGFGTMMGESTLAVGQEVSVRVLRISRGQVTLTMKKEENIQKTDVQVGQGVVHTATNPFLLAFRQNKDIAAFLDEREKVEEKVKEPEKVASEASEAQTTQEVVIKDEVSVEQPEDATVKEEVVESIAEETSVKDEVAVQEAEDATVKEEVVEPKAEETTVKAEGAVQEAEDETVKEEVVEPVTEETTVKDEVAVQEAEDETVKEEVVEPVTEDTTVKDEVAVQESEDATVKEEVVESIAEETIVKDEVVVQETDDATVKEEIVEPVAEETTAKDEVVKEEVVEQKAEETTVKDEVAIQEAMKEVPQEAEKTSESDNNGSVVTADSQSDDPPSEAAKATISPALVKQLREESGAGMMDCKRALAESGGDIIKATEYLRKKGLASAEKKASRATAEGRIGSYIHDSRIGVLVELNCETDFVSRGEIFKELVDDVAMQIAACPQVLYIGSEDVPNEFAEKEREIEMQKEDLASKPEPIRSKIVDGRVKKRLDELALLEQAYIKNDKILMKDWVKQTIATVGENIKVKRFIRYNLGEGLEKKSQDFAAEVAAQTAAKPLAPKDKAPASPEEAKETVEKPPTVAVSAALVKQLRDETGAGMMDCKKALSESGGDMEKAQEYLRKKGLSSADKKSTRLAAEGRIGAYIHDSRIGVLIEVNCETDFVARNEAFKELVDDLAMQVVACPNVRFVSVEDVGNDVVEKEKEIERQREDLRSKPENIREKIVEGRVSKRLGELALLEQPFVKNDTILVKDLLKQTVATLGENIKVRRFVRFTLGEA